MKNLSLLFVALLLATVSPVSGRNFYVSAAGNNAYDGLTQATAWQTISKVNASFASIAPGDSILFRRGDTFFGALVVAKSGRSGSPIVIGAFGTGLKPVITGFVKATSWVEISDGIYQSTISNAINGLNIVTLNNQPQPMGRYPNSDEANGGYLRYESFNGSTSITDNELTSSINWTGAEAVIRKKLWVLDRCKITSHSGTTITYTNTNSSTYDGTLNFGYFIQNDPRTLDRLGEWYFKNSTKALQVYFGAASPSAYTVKVSAIDTLLIVNGQSYITITDLAFEGSNGDEVYGTNASNLSVLNCDFTNAGEGAINIHNISTVLIENCTTNYILSNAVKVTSTIASGATIRNCSLKNTGTLPGLGLSNGNSYKALYVNIMKNILLEYNRIDTCGYVGIEFQGSDVMIRNNVVNYFDFIKDDGGGIYTWASGTDASPGPYYTNRVIKDNIVMNGIGAPNGRSTSALFVTGIYLDGRTMNVDVLNNSVFNNGKNGIHCNNPTNINIRGNTSFNNLNCMSVMRWAWGSISGLTIRNNVIYPKTESQRAFYYTNSGLNEPVPNTVQNVLTTLGNIDSNYYNMVNPVGLNFELYATSGGASIPQSPLSLEGWRAFTSHDANSKRPAKSPINYKLVSLVGANKFSNGLFSANITGITLFGSSFTGTWDNTGKISGGSIKLGFSAPAANKYGTIHSALGAVSSAKKYIFRFSTYGTTQQGYVRAYLRKTISPYTSLVPVQVKSFGIGRKDHEFLFDAPVSDAGASFVIEVEQNSGTTYVDNIEFYEANAVVYNPNDQIRFEYNDTKLAKTIALDGIYTAVNGTVYTSNITLQPYTSAILIRDTSSRAPLNVTATATAIKCYGDSSTITVSATGGTPGYTGTGSFRVKAGVFLFTVTDATGATATASVTITQPAAPLSIAAAAAGVITTAGGTTTVTVTATGGTAPYTGTGSFTVPAGTYTYRVTDANGCTSSTTITVYSAGGQLVATSDKTVININCFGGSADVKISATAGSAPYTGIGTFPVRAGKGSLKITFPTNSAGSYTAYYYTVGPISSAKRYVLRFTTLGTTNAGKLRASIRQTARPFASLTARQNGTFGTARKDHEFRFVAPPTEAAASFQIDVEQASGTTYIDNIAFFETDTAGNLKGDNLYAYGQFEKSIANIFSWSSNSNQSNSWDTTGMITSTNYFTVTDSLRSSSVVVVNTTQPATALKISAAAGIINAPGGTTTVSITATGGTAPYTGAGSFTVTAGTYNYTITDAKGCTATTTVSLAVSSARPAPQTIAERTVADASPQSTAGALQLMAYPNPTNNSFNLVAQGGTTEKLTVIVYSFDGKIAWQTSGTTNNRYVIGSNFMPGVYMVKVIQGNTSRVIKVVKAGN